ncbi:MAG: 4Fe-4S binding protein [Myxococcota bacterium]
MSRAATSRRGFFRGFVRELAGAAGSVARELEAPREEPPPPADESAPPAPRRRPPPPVHRPPGAIDEASFLEVCTGCDACAEACPHGSIVPAPPRLRHAAGTPVIDPHRAPCHLCPDTPCISACEPGALRPDQPRRMGTAHIQKHQCLSWRNEMCSVCIERCPVPGALTSDRGRPVVDGSLCDGCGLCMWYCPAPVNAILVLPARDRPAPPTETPDAG